MKLALITPVSFLGHATSRSNYHLVLPELLMAYPEYYHAYAILAENPDHYLILDNGAAEGELVNNETLLKLATSLGVDEVVAPDVLRDRDGTVTRSLEFLLEYGIGFRDGRYRELNIGIVGQGDNAKEAKLCIAEIVSHGVSDPIKTIHIPRLLVKGRETRYARIDLAMDFKREFRYNKYDIHLLGASPVWPKEIRAAAGTRIIRGMDTSMPFNYAYAREWLEGTTKQVWRPPGYFDLRRAQFYGSGVGKRQGTTRGDILDTNLEVVFQWARGERQ